MPDCYISNFIPSHNYPHYANAITRGTRLDVDEITRTIIHTKPTDDLVIDGDPAISAVCLLVWLQVHGNANVIRYGAGSSHVFNWAVTLRMIEKIRDEETKRG